MNIIAPLPEHIVRPLLQHASQDDFFVFLETTRISEENRLSYLFRQPEEMIRFYQGDDPAAFFARAEQYLENGKYLAGWFAYEFGYLLEPRLVDCLQQDAMAQPLVELGVFSQPFIYDHLNRRFKDDRSWPLAEVDELDDINPKATAVRPSQQKAQYLDNIAAVKKYIEAGDTYQVNYTLKLLFDYQGDACDFYTRFRRNQRVGYGGFIKSGSRSILSYSPELFFTKNNESCLVRPMKGTIRRGRNVQEDQAMAQFLHNDPKNRSENVMIVDLLRNDLGRLCETGSVKVHSLFDVAAFETLQQMTSTIEGKLRPDLGLLELFRALYPCGSVTGAPKIRTMQIINELETSKRGVYTGAIGFMGPDGSACFNVPIRTLQLENGKGEMGIGSGVVYDSDPESEWDECLLKSHFLSKEHEAFKLIETILWQRDFGFRLLGLHLSRLQDSATHFLYPLDREAVRQALDGLSDELLAGTQQAVRVRLLLDQQGGIELSHAECEPVEIDFLAALSNGAGNNRPRIKISQQRTDPNLSWLYHKTTQRQLYNKEREKAVDEGFFEVIFMNGNDEITEGSITNVFAKFGDTIKTPPLSCGLLNGVLRQHLFERLSGDEPDAAGKPSLTLQEAVLSKKDLAAADRLFVGNSVRGLVEVVLA